ncbi:MAG: HesA/MoeB/ThiF family protein, partial [Bdellovibrionota bacterium]
SQELGRQPPQKLLPARVLSVGVGGLGSPAALYLASAGVGTIGICDDDRVGLSNLQRQILYRTSDIGRPKTEAAREKLKALWPDGAVRVPAERFTEKNARETVRQYDVVLEGSDNFETKFLANDACVAEGKPLVIGGILRFDGQVQTVLPGKGACYRCLFERPPPAGTCPSCAEAGVIGALAGLVGCIQAAEAIKLLLGIGESLSSRLLTVDALGGKFREVPLARRPGCSACGHLTS